MVLISYALIICISIYFTHLHKMLGISKERISKTSTLENKDY